jgi:hypothetical protein
MLQTYTESNISIFFFSTLDRVIISELYLPIEQKTLKPSSSFGGVAGGAKYTIQVYKAEFGEDLLDLGYPI